MYVDNATKRKPKGEIKFSITLNEEQKLAKEQILKKPINFIFGQVGSGKTLLACQIGLDMYFNRQVEKIIITRPTVSTEDNGFLPGTIEEKMDPWLVPIRDNMAKCYKDHDKLQKMEQEKKIELVALTYFRGRTFENCVCIIDEFQNLTESQLEMCMGRLGKGSVMIFCGDLDQIDLQSKFKQVSSVVNVIKKSQYVNYIVLTENHRHEALVEIFGLIKKYKNGN